MFFLGFRILSKQKKRAVFLDPCLLRRGAKCWWNVCLVVFGVICQPLLRSGLRRPDRKRGGQNQKNGVPVWEGNSNVSRAWRDLGIFRFSKKWRTRVWFSPEDLFPSLFGLNKGPLFSRARISIVFEQEPRPGLESSREAGRAKKDTILREREREREVQISRARGAFQFPGRGWESFCARGIYILFSKFFFFLVLFLLK